MPVNSCSSNGKPGYKFGDSGACYTYTPGDSESRKSAKAKASAQERAVRASGYTGKDVDMDDIVAKFSALEMSSYEEFLDKSELKELPPLSPGEQYFAEALRFISLKYGKLEDGDSTGIWVGYVEPENNEDKNIGVKCHNCYFYMGNEVCTIVKRQINHEGICRLAAIPDGLVNVNQTVNKDDEFVINVVSPNGGMYIVDGKNNPVLSFMRGNRYTINVNAKTHPFYFQTSSLTYDTDLIYTSGVTGSGTDVGTIIFQVPEDAPDSLTYVCSNHPNMGNSVVISDHQGSKPADPEMSMGEDEDMEYFVRSKDPSKTPAPRADRRAGSSRNKPGSAQSGSKVTFSDGVITSLQNKIKEHNEKTDAASKKATLGALKAVYRRGAGAFSTSHRPGMARGQWAMARVNAYLFLLRNGRPSNPKYTTDNDLLPKGHPRSSK